MKISTGTGAVILAMCAGAASASGAAAAARPAHPAAPDGALPAATALESQVRKLPAHIGEMVELPYSVDTPLPARAEEAGDQHLDFGPLGMLSAKEGRPAEPATRAVGGALARLSALSAKLPH